MRWRTRNRNGREGRQRGHVGGPINRHANGRIMALTIGVPRETLAGEKRVATVPEVVEKLIKQGFAVAVESCAGDAANFSDDTYRAAGAQIIEGAAKLWAASDIVFKIGVPTTGEVGLMREGGTLIGFIWPAQRSEERRVGKECR